jgi:hypothetical protein
MPFTQLQVHPELIAALGKQQIDDPTPIQVAAHSVLLAGKDAYLHAETGRARRLPTSCRSLLVSTSHRRRLKS